MSQYTKDLAALNKTGNMTQPGAMPDKGVSVGMEGYDSMGMSTDINATNKIGKMKDACSDPAMECCPGAAC